MQMTSIYRAGAKALIVALVAAGQAMAAGWTNWYEPAYPASSVFALAPTNVPIANLWCRTNLICYTNWLSPTNPVVVRTNITFDCRIDWLDTNTNTPQSRVYNVDGLTRYDTNGLPYTESYVITNYSTMTQLACRVQARDVWCIDAYFAWKERAAAADYEWWNPVLNPILDEPPLFIYTQNREHLEWLKNATEAILGSYVNTSAVGALSQPAMTNVQYWTATGIAVHVSAPQSYFDATDYAMLNTTSNGWRYLRHILSMMTVTANDKANMEQDWEIQWHIAPGIATNWPIGICDAPAFCSVSSNDSALLSQSSVTWQYSQLYASHPDPNWEDDNLQWLIDLGLGATNGELSFSETEWKDDVKYSHAIGYQAGNFSLLSNLVPYAYSYQRRSLSEGNTGGYEAGAGAYPIGSTITTGYVWTADAAGQAVWSSNHVGQLEAPRMYDLQHDTIGCYDQWTMGIDFGLQEWDICLTNFYSGGQYNVGEFFNFTIEPITLWDWGTTNGFRYR